jgi:hypothetical protein
MGLARGAPADASLGAGEGENEGASLARGVSSSGRGERAFRATRRQPTPSSGERFALPARAKTCRLATREPLPFPPASWSWQSSKKDPFFQKLLECLPGLRLKKFLELIPGLRPDLIFSSLIFILRVPLFIC